MADVLNEYIRQSAAVETLDPEMDLFTDPGYQIKMGGSFIGFVGCFSKVLEGAVININQGSL